MRSFVAVKASVGVGAALLAAGSLLVPSAQAAEPVSAFAVDAPRVSVELANHGYAPVLLGPAAASDLGDPNDCSITGYESRVVGAASASKVKGCGAVRLQAGVSSKDANGVVSLSAKANVTYGCVRGTRTRALFTQTEALTGSLGNNYPPLVLAGATTSIHGAAAMLPARTGVTCRRSETPAQLSVTVTEVTVTVASDFGRGTVETHRFAGNWSASLAVVAATL